MKKTIEIPEGYEARIEGNKVILEPKENEDEKIRKFLVELVSNDKYNDYGGLYEERNVSYDDALAYLERQKEQEQPEVDLEEEVKRWKNKYGVVGMDDLWLDFARHFYELGLNARKEK